MLRFLRKSENIFSLHKRNFHVNSNHSDFIPKELSAFLTKLHNNNSNYHQNCMEQRERNQAENIFCYREDTEEIRKSDWTANTIPENLRERHVELTGPGNNPKMVINAMNSSADCYMLDIEDSMSPSWNNVVNAHQNISLVSRGELKYETKKKLYEVTNDTPPTLLVRARGLHMFEENVVNENNTPIQATLFDIGTHLFNNGAYMNNTNQGPYLYIPKLENYEDAIYVNNIITQSEEILGLHPNSTKVTVLIETFPAIFQTHEIIYALKDRIVGLNCGRWDYIFSMMKSLNTKIEFPDRNTLTMNQPFLESYVEQIVNTCHERGIHAMGGMSAFIPTKDTEENNEIIKTILQDKELEIERGCDGAWVAHPGLISPIKELFNEKLEGANQINGFKGTKTLVENSRLRQLEYETQFTQKELENNISVALQYISAWLHGNGAVAINNLMEDLATAEISAAQLKNWKHFNTSLTNLHDSDKFINIFNSTLENQLDKLKQHSQVEYAKQHFNTASYILLEYLNSDAPFLHDIANKHLKYERQFDCHTFEQSTLDLLGGSHKYLSGVELTKHRGEFLNRYLYEENNDAYKFLGTSNGVSAVNVVAGGKGKVGPYSGGWQANAMKNRLNMNLPDTLHVAVEDVSICAEEMNYHLEKADQVQHINKSNDPDFNDCVNYYDLALLADLEQGWSIPEKTRIAVKKAIQNGVNVIHIEDQGVAKRCGHLGDKELATYEDYAVIMRSANLAAQELLGPEQVEKQWVRFVSRTDAYSAKRIHNSDLLRDPENPEHKFIDWNRGASDDGKYLFLNQGINPETGNRWGLDLSILRSTRIVDDGLASHVWMETPDADLQVAKDYLTTVNKNLSKEGKRAYGLYNHSPSFDWDVKFFSEAEPFANKLCDYVAYEALNYANSMCEPSNAITMNRLLEKGYRQSLENIVKKFLENEGERVQGDHLFLEENIQKITQHIVDKLKGEKKWKKRLNKLKNTSDSFIGQTLNKTLDDDIYNPTKKITEIIVDQRLSNFSSQLASFGFNMHLITLPEFHVTAYNMHKLAAKFPSIGINAFVRDTQRPERIYSTIEPTYTYYKHQSATGTGVEAAFNTAVGSADVNTLSDSTEADDMKKRDD
jgi:malate synthase